MSSFDHLGGISLWITSPRLRHSALAIFQGPSCLLVQFFGRPVGGKWCNSPVTVGDSGPPRSEAITQDDTANWRSSQDLHPGKNKFRKATLPKLLGSIICSLFKSGGNEFWEKRNRSIIKGSGKRLENPEGTTHSFVPFFFSCLSSHVIFLMSSSQMVFFISFKSNLKVLKPKPFIT